jgi:hypothetical protein
MATDVRLGDISGVLQRWQTEWQSAQAAALERVCAMLQGEARAIIGDDEKSARLRDNIKTAVDGDDACVGVPGGIIGDGSCDDRKRDIGEEAVAREFGGTATPALSFLGAAAARRLEDVGSGLAEDLAEAFRRSLPGAAGHAR